MSPRGQQHPQMICLMQEELEVSADRPGAQPRKQAYQIKPTFTRKGHDPSFRDTPPSSEFFLMPFSLIPEFGRFRQIKSSQLFDYQRVQSFFNLLSCVHARACP